MAKIDTETLFLKLKAFVQANIAGVVAQINTEKNDSTLLVAPDAKAYVDLSLDSSVMNYDPFIFIYIDSVQSTIAGPAVNKNVRFEICLFKAKTGKTDELIQGLRYMRLMEDLAQLAWDKALRGFRYEVETLTPVDVQLANSTKWHRVYGVALTVSLA
jgi:hypothetical protein